MAGSLLQEDIALHHEVDEVAQVGAVPSQLLDDAVDFAAIDRFQLSSGGVGQHLFGEAAHHQWLAAQEHLLELDDVGDLGAIR